MTTPLDMECTACHAPPGKPCVRTTLGGPRKPVTWFHWDRIVAGEKANHEKWEAQRQQRKEEAS